MQPDTIAAPAMGRHQLDPPEEPPDPLPRWPLLSGVRGPADLKSLAPQELPRLAAEIRDFLVDAVSRTGGHLGPSLGAVELTIALHRVFDSPRDRIVWDTGHQAYVHKLLTGRHDFSRLRCGGGLSGYPSRAESEHDIVENSHASTALGYADGLAKAHHLLGQPDRRVVAVVGDGALTGGMAWEALNNIAAAPGRPLVILVNDNGRSYAGTVGGLANHLSTLRNGVSSSTTIPRSGGTWRHPNFFTILGLAYLGPVDGHDAGAVEAALQQARDLPGPVVVHCVTRKGCGYPPAEQDQADHLHAVGVIEPRTGRPATPPATASWTSVFGEEMVAIGRLRPDVVAITAAMLEPVGLKAFARAFPDRIFDVGIAEQHATASAAGLATAGMHPVVAIYSTFLNRAFDQVLMDVALHRCGVTFVLDRAGITGTDGPSHNGMWDLSVFQAVPGLRIAAPRDTGQLRAQLREAITVRDAPTIVRFPKAEVVPDIAAIDRIGGADVLFRSAVPGRAGADPVDVLLVAVGAMAGPCLHAAELLADGGFSATVVDPRWVKPVDPELVRLAAVHRLVVTVEDGGCAGGAGAAFAQALSQANIDTPVRHLGIPQEFPLHAARADILAAIGLDGPGIAGRAASFARMVVTDWPGRERPPVRPVLNDLG